MSKFKHHDIKDGDIVKANGLGYMYWTEPPPDHPYAMPMKDRNKKYLYLHVARMENKLGRFLDPKTEQVHHKNGNKKDNSPGNLEVALLGEHQRDHANNGNSFWENSSANKKGTKKNKPKKSKKASAEGVSPLSVVMVYLSRS